MLSKTILISAGIYFVSLYIFGLRAKQLWAHYTALN
jgi:hypothetical protein